MSTISIEEAQSRLPELIDKLLVGEEIVITRDRQPVAKLLGHTPKVRLPRQPGTLKGTVLYIAPDFDAPLDESRL